MKNFILTLAATAALTITAAAGTYHLSDLGALPGQTGSSIPGGINNAGQVTGTSGGHAFRYSNGTMQDLGTLPGGNLSSATALNVVGDVVGSSQFTDGGAIRHATLWTANGTATDLGTLPNGGNYSLGRAINSSQVIVGSVSPTLTGTNTRAFILYPGSAMQDMGTLGGQYALAAGINDNGYVTGSSQVPIGFGPSHAFIWDGYSGMHDLGTLAGSTSSGAAINRHAHIVGSSTINDVDNRQHAFLYDGTMHDLGSLGAEAFESDRSGALALNSYDEVVGTTYVSTGSGTVNQVAFVYRGGAMFNLNQLVDATGADYQLLSATGINDVGQIVAQATRISTNETRAVLLTPNSVPVTFTNVADSTSPVFKGFGGSPTINDSGEVAYNAELDAGGIGIFRTDVNGNTVKIADDGTGAPSINNAGEVASRQFVGAEVQLYKGTSSATLQTIAQTGNYFNSFPGFTYLADSGISVFYATRYPASPVIRGIYAGIGNGQTTQVIDNTGAFNSFGANPSISNAGIVAFSASLDTPVGGIWIGNTSGNNATQPVITMETSSLYNFDGAPFINDNGEIAFLANDVGPAVFLINSDGSGLRKIADVAGEFSQLRPPVINNVGTFVFFAFTDQGGHGIFNGPDALANKIVATGDPLFGSTVASLGFFRGLSNDDQVAFFYSLADGRTGIARAKLTLPNTPVAVASRKTHANAGTFDLPLSVAGTPAIESRGGGDYQIVFTFPAPVSYSGASVTPAAGATATINTTPTAAAAGTEVAVSLTNVSSGQTLTVRLHDVNSGGDVAVPVSILVGDVNGDGFVNAADATIARNRSGQAVNASNFGCDFNGDGFINSADSTIARNNSGKSLGSPSPLITQPLRAKAAELMRTSSSN
ncbi:MAG: choice-of-anchor tandem repeat NxxGxxAF-containing protein [Chthoniobacterales bacterium]